MYPTKSLPSSELMKRSLPAPLTTRLSPTTAAVPGVTPPPYAKPATSMTVLGQFPMKIFADTGCVALALLKYTRAAVLPTPDTLISVEAEPLLPNNEMCENVACEGYGQLKIVPPPDPLHNIIV